MISRAYYVQCDHCGDPAEVSCTNAEEARDFARQQGYKRVTAKRCDREGRLLVRQTDLCRRCFDAWKSKKSRP
jgi:hypothetical protein